MMYLVTLLLLVTKRNIYVDFCLACDEVAKARHRYYFSGGGGGGVSFFQSFISLKV